MMTAPAFQNADARERPTRGERDRPSMPALSAVLREHIRVTGLVLRGPALIAAALIGLVTLVAWLQSVSMGVVLYFYEWPTLLPGLMGALLPVAVWARDERSGHGYLWTLPVDRRRHAFTKVFAGWVWLMVGVALFALWRPVLTLASGGRVLPPETLYLLTTHVPLAGPLDQTTLQAVRWTPSPLIWAVPFTAATGSYLLGSALVLASRRPLRWVIGTVLAYAIVSVVSDAAGAQFRVSWLMDAPGGLLERLVQGRYGLDALLTARTGTLSTIVPLATGQRAMVWRAVPDLSDWHIATFVWTGAGLLALWLAAFRHREQRRA